MDNQTNNVAQDMQRFAQMHIVDNVEYRIFDTFKIINILKDAGFKLSDAALLPDINLIHNEVLAQGLLETQWQSILNKTEKPVLFQENILGKFILHATRKFVKNPITDDGVVKEGFFNRLSAYGLQVPGVTGKKVSRKVVKNGVTNAGFAGAASRLNGAGSEAAFTYIAVGTGTTAFAAGNTALETETAASGLSRVSATASRVTTTQTNDTAQLQTTFTVTGTVAVTESGVLNASSSGVLLCRQTFSAINVVNGDSLQITWKVKCA